MITGSVLTGRGDRLLDRVVAGTEVLGYDGCYDSVSLPTAVE